MENKIENFGVVLNSPFCAIDIKWRKSMELLKVDTLEIAREKLKAAVGEN